MHRYGDELKAEAMLMHLGLARKAQRVTIRAQDDPAPIFVHLEGCMRSAGYLYRDIFAVRLILQEVLTDAFRHGSDDSDKCVDLTFIVTPAGVIADVQNDSGGFLFDDRPAPLAAENSGRFGGVSLMRMYATWVCFHKAANRLTLCR